MSLTDRKVIDAVLAEIGMLPANATPSAADVANIEAVLEQVRDLMERRDVGAWFTDDTPGGLFRPLVRLVAAYAGPAYGLQTDENTLEQLLNSVRIAYMAGDGHPKAMTPDFPFMRRVC